MRHAAWITLFVLLFCGLSRPASATEEAPAEKRSVVATSWAVLMYLPNRVFDLVDVARLRLRVGPGYAFGLRATSAAQFYLGSYVSAWGGLPGPRMKRTIPIPAGLETYNGAALSFVNATVDGPIGPDYSPTECGLSLHLLLIGIDLELDPVEAGDFFTGIVGIDIRDDDL